MTEPVEQIYTVTYEAIVLASSHEQAARETIANMMGGPCWEVTATRSALEDWIPFQGYHGASPETEEERAWVFRNDAKAADPKTIIVTQLKDGGYISEESDD